MTHSSGAFPDRLRPERLSGMLAGGGNDPELFEAADAALRASVGDGVYLRGLVEVSSRCGRGCLYCGLRAGNPEAVRYEMSREEVVRAIRGGYGLGLRSFLLQSGELPSKSLLETVTGVLETVREEMPGTRMVLSMGELPPGLLDRLRRAGAHRYLLRMESFDPGLYARFHPEEDGTWEGRLQVLRHLRDTGWQTGTGVLVGLPGQTTESLARDLLAMREADVDMVGMGPLVPCEGTPLWEERDSLPGPDARVLLTLRMTALLRLMVPDLNIAATTALQTLATNGLERALSAGANVVMPNLTPEPYRSGYVIYPGKGTVADSPAELLDELAGRSGAMGRRLVLGDSGDPPHYGSRMRRMPRAGGGLRPGTVGR